MKLFQILKSEDSFTLIELLVVIAILAVLATVVVLVINPAELLRQGRDSVRLNDLNNINKVLGLLQVDCISCSLGNPNTVYVSIPDTSPICGNLGLPSLPSGWSYACVTENNLTKVDGTGWIPVDFTQFSAGSPLSRLPIDPVNTTSSGQYYTYVTGQSWELTASFESSKYAKTAADDGGVYPPLYEVGTGYLLPILPNNLLDTATQNDFSGSPWVNEANGSPPFTNYSITTDYTTGPNGVAGADRIERTPSHSNDGMFLRQNIPFSAGSRYRMYIWLKSNTVSTSTLIGFCCAAGNSQKWVTVNPTWQVFSHEFTATDSATANVRIVGDPPAAHGVDFSAWGAQVIKLK